jgi:hypothetical protein
MCSRFGSQVQIIQAKAQIYSLADMPSITSANQNSFKALAIANLKAT